MENVAIQNTSKSTARMLGWDAWRFIGAFLVFWGHNSYSLSISIPELSAPATLAQEFTFPLFAWALMYSAVPVFVFIAGFFALRKPPAKGDWIKAKTSFWKYIIQFWKWLVFAIVLYIIFPNLWGAFGPNFNEHTIGENISMVLRGFISTSPMTGNGVLLSTAPVNYFIIALGWLALLAPILRYFVHCGNLKMIRSLTVILTFMGLIFNGVELIGTTLLESNPTSQFALFLSQLSPFSTAMWDWSGCFWIVYFLWGGVFAVDKELQERVKNIKWSTIAICAVVAVFIQGVLQLYFGNFATVNIGTYQYGGGILLTIVFIVAAHKWNFLIKAESKFGKFVKAFAPDLLAEMTLGCMFVTQLCSSALQPYVRQFALATWEISPMVTTAIWFVINVAVFFLTVFLAHYIAKIPYVGQLLKWPEMKKYKERAAQKAAAEEEAAKEAAEEAVAAVGK